MSNQFPAARWFTVSNASQYSGINTRTLQNYIKDELIVSSTVKRPGAARGRRLICRESLDAFIEAGIGKSADIDFTKKG